jgi:hypothetical protein
MAAKKPSKTLGFFFVFLNLRRSRNVPGTIQFHHWDGGGDERSDTLGIYAVSRISVSAAYPTVP